MICAFRLRAYHPNGSLRGSLPAPTEWEFGTPFNDLASSRLSYSDIAPGHEHLLTPSEVAVELSTDGVTWTEVPNGRFARTNREFEMGESGTVRKYPMKSYAWVMKSMRQLQTTNLNADGKRAFLSANLGQILKVLIDENQSQGIRPGLAYNFDAVRDSAGQPWANIITIYYEPGLDLFTILSNLTDQGMCDWRLRGRTLEVYNPDTVMGQTRNVKLLLGRDIKAMTVSGDSTDIATDAMVIGEGGKLLRVSNPAASSPWGKAINHISQGGVSDPGTMNLLGMNSLEADSQERVQYTVEINSETTIYAPYRDYSIGDYITSINESGEPEVFRVRQITPTRSSEGVYSFNLVLNDRFIEREIRLARRTNGIVGGASSTGGSGTRPAPEGPDNRIPAKVAGLVMTSDAITDSEGRAQAVIRGVWNPVTAATDGTAMNVIEYQIYGRRNAAGHEYREITRSATPNFEFSPLPIAQNWRFKVRAIGEGAKYYGFWSDEYAITLAHDNTPPPVPSRATATSGLGIVEVSWDGKNASGGGMPIDFDRSEIKITTGDTGDSAGLLLEDGFRRAGTYAVAGLSVGTTYRVFLRSVDFSDNKSNWNLATEVTVRSIRDADLVNTTLVAQINEAATGPIDGSRMIPGTTRLESLSVGIGNRVVDSEFAEPLLRARRTMGTVTWSPITEQPGSSYAAIASATGYFFWGTGDTYTANMIPVRAGDSLYLGAYLRRAVTTSAFRFVCAVRRADGSISLISASGLITPTTISTWYDTTFAVPADAVSVQVGIYVTVGSVRVERPYWQPQNSAVTIANGAITSPKIETNAIGAREANINELWSDNAFLGAARVGVLTVNSVSAVHIGSDALTVKHTITGSKYQTTATNARGIKIETDGQKAYNSVGARTYFLSAATGEVEQQGKLIAGNPNGINVEITPSAYGSRPGVRFDHGSNVGLKPVMYSVGSGVDDYPFRAIVLHGSETTINSSGRFDLVGEHGGNFKIAQTWGTHSGTGIHKTGQDLSIHGRLTRDQGARRQTIVGSGASWQYMAAGADLAWIINYGAPSYSGRRRVMAVAHSFEEFGACTATVRNATAASVQISLHAIKAGNYLYAYTAFWEEP